MCHANVWPCVSVCLGGMCVGLGDHLHAYTCACVFKYVCTHVRYGEHVCVFVWPCVYRWTCMCSHMYIGLGMGAV